MTNEIFLDFFSKSVDGLKSSSLQYEVNLVLQNKIAENVFPSKQILVASECNFLDSSLDIKLGLKPKVIQSWKT